MIKSANNNLSREKSSAFSLICVLLREQTKRSARMATTASRLPAEKIILGIDPGTNVLGYGIIKVAGRSSVRMEAMGVIDLRHCKDAYLKLGRIYERVTAIIDRFLPDEVAIESPFFGKNVQSMLKLGRAQGVAIAASIGRDIPVHEYAPLKIKMSITGNGGASKEQVAGVLKNVLNIREDAMPPFLDATDALAAAYCHYLQGSMPQYAASAGAPKTWGAYLQQHRKTVSAELTGPQRKLNALLCKKS